MAIHLFNHTDREFSGMVPISVARRVARHTAQRFDVFNLQDPSDERDPVSLHFGSPVGAYATMAWGRFDMGPQESLLLRATNVSAMRGELAPFADHFTDAADKFAVTINGMPLRLVPHEPQMPIEVDGPALRAHFRGRVSMLVVADLDVCWVPGEPWARFEVTYTAANPEFPARTEPLHGFDLRIGDGLVGYAGGRFGAMLQDTRIAHGAQRIFSGAVLFVDEARHGQQDQFMGLLNLSPMGIDQDHRPYVAGMGVQDVGEQFDGREIIVEHVSEAYSAVYSWGKSRLGVAKLSPQTGAQDEQTHGGHRPELFGKEPHCGIAAVMARFVSEGFAKRPCNYREMDGEPLDWNAHPNLRFWDGRPHLLPNVSPDRLGLTEGLPSSAETHGWYGPDKQHTFAGTLYTVAMVWGSRAAQHQLRSLADVFRFQYTLDVGASTTHFDSARSVGWEGLLAVGLYLSLSDRRLAQQVREHARRRLGHLAFELDKGTHQPAIWDPRQDDRLRIELEHHFENIYLKDGTQIARSETLPENAASWETVYRWDQAWMPYQQAVGSYGLYVAGQVFNVPNAVEVAVQGARAVVEFAYTTDGGEIKEWGVMAVGPHGGRIDANDYQEGKGASSGHFYRHAWMPMAVWVMAVHEPDVERHRMIWDKLHEEAMKKEKDLRWLPPIDRRPLTIADIVGAES